MERIIVAITGASGSIYAKRLVEFLLKKSYQVDLLVTDAGKEVIKHEIGLDLINSDDISKTLEDYFGYICEGKLRYREITNLTADIASGSVNAKAMVVVPCTMGTIAAIATGSSDNLLERAADVMLKEKRRLILVPRETPLSTIHFRNMLALSEMQVDIVPAMPAFYHKPQSIDDLVNFIVGKILNLLQIEHNLFTPWRGESIF
ncbi:MAG: flavin prenyltransferase [Clostridia bacterium]|jgi:4-hydroxy-3-polyprenylbenzoate decarboxylase|nr:flavin prenyltransferase [Clostridia bacterium]MDN5322428.1 flavin prenyltransferase [Clostridia bacterium]